VFRIALPMEGASCWKWSRSASATLPTFLIAWLATADSHFALFSTFVIGLTNVLFTLVSFWVIDRYGCNPLYIVGSLGMTAVLLLLVLASALGRFAGMTVLVLIMAYMAFFAACIGPVFWTLVQEIFPNRVRGTAMPSRYSRNGRPMPWPCSSFPWRSTGSARRKRSPFWA
jgi:MFS family permease